MKTDITTPPSPATSPSLAGDALIAHLDARILLLLQQVRNSDMWRTLTDPGTDPRLVRAIMREAYLEIFSYNASIVEATIALIGQMPRSLPARRLKAMLHHQADEFDHGEMGLKDFVALGGDEAQARRQRISPQSFAAAGVWWMMVQQREPFAYLGAEYLFESFTPMIAEQVQPFLEQKGLPKDSLGFIEFHAKEDISHTNLMQQLIKDVAAQYPEAAEAIVYGLECFLTVYPFPVWEAAYQRALAQFVQEPALKAAA